MCRHSAGLLLLGRLMADFDVSFKNTMRHEGAYVCDHDDAGGETYMGISRHYHPEWTGWSFVDSLKGSDNFESALEGHKQLQASVRRFYRNNYWNRFQGDRIPNQSIADELFDIAVNLGVHRAVVFIQKGLNYLNRCGTSWRDIVEDGKFGPASMAALQSCLREEQPEYLLIIANVLQGMHYLDYMSRKPSQEKYARGWLKRVRFSRSERS